MKISEYLRNGPNYKWLHFPVNPDQKPENISDLVDRISKHKNLLVDFDENFRECQKWARLPNTRFPFRTGLEPVSGIYPGLQIQNVKTHKLLVDFDENLRLFQNEPNYSFLLFIRTTGTVSGKYSGFVSAMSKLKKLLVVFYVNFRVCQKWAKLLIPGIFCLSGKYIRI